MLRELAPQVLGPVVRRFGDFDAGEDAVQEALIAAAERWPAEGVPPDPRGWLIRTATWRLTDLRRSERSRREREARAAALETPGQPIEEDDSLVVLFMASHPALGDASAIALTLRAVGGLTTEEIARAFLVPTATMAQRISRAKERIRASGVPFELPAPEERGDRLRTVLRVLYLIFNEGYTTTGGGDLQRVDLAAEAIRLARMARRLVPGEAEPTGLLALMLLIDARRDARTDAAGELVPLEAQDRSSWDRGRIAEGLALLEEAMTSGAGEYTIQAAIAALHDRAPTADATDWLQIAALHELLERLTGNPVVRVNRAVAVGMADGPRAGLALLETVDDRVPRQRLEAVRAHLLELAGEIDAAVVAYRAAEAASTNVREQRYLAKRVARLRTGG
ncbi:MAG TPA: DUF6596 domain-containing protein [Candidatus Limnocylindrales bacterium]|nr:DUF6596 domain-containing protein [Candidatus Limnocylindrales bacterium]